MKRHSFCAAATLAVGAGVASGQDRSPVAGERTADRLSELERKLDEQGKELEKLRREEAPAGPHGEPGHEPGGKPGEKAASAEKHDGPRTEYDAGFQVRGEIGGSEYLIRPIAGIELDYHAYPHAKKTDQFLVQRAILGFSGQFAVFDYDFEVCPTRGSGGGLPLDNFWFQLHTMDELMVRVGHYRTPFTAEDLLINPFYVDLAGAPMVVDSLAPDLRPGAEILGRVGGHLFKDRLSVQNQTDSNKVVSGDPLVSARLMSVFQGFSFGVAGVWENLSGTQESIEGATPGGFRWFDPVDVRGWTQRYEVDVFYEHGPFFVGGEFLYVSQERWRVLADKGNGTALISQGFYATAGFMFWGPSSAEGEGEAAEGKPHPGGHHAGKLPEAPFTNWKLFNMDIERRGNGRNVGLEIVTRVEWMSVGEARGGRKGQDGIPASPSTAADADKIAGNDARAVSVGFNLDLIENVRFMADWVHLRVGDQSRAEKAHSRFSDEFLLRAQLEF